MPTTILQEMDDEYTCIAADETALVKAFNFKLSPQLKYRILNILLGRKNSVYAAFSHVSIGYNLSQQEARSVCEGVLTPSGGSAFSTVPVANFSDNLPKSTVTNATGLYVAFFYPKNGDKCTVNLLVEVTSP